MPDINNTALFAKKGQFYADFPLTIAQTCGNLPLNRT
jgi:hypothetical protein